MLVLQRKLYETIRIETPSGEVIRVMPVRFGPHAVRLAFEAETDIKIVREELLTPEEQPLEPDPAPEALPAA